MPLRLDVKKKLLARSDRVKCVDLHPTETWMLVALYNGNVHIWNYENQQLVKSFEVCEVPVRCAKFIPRKNWIVTGSDDMHVRIFNYNTLERVHQFEAHSDYVRSIAVHPTHPFILTCSDDMLIKLWDWENKWSVKQTFEGHTHYVMQLVINPKDNNTFATASLDRMVKVWHFGSSTANFTLEGHEKGVNCVDYYHGGDKPYLISGADDRLVKIWDYQNKTCVATLDGHAQNVSAVCFHPELPVIITGSEDSTVRLWHASTYRLETTLNYGLERVWCIHALRGSNTIAIGYDEGAVTVKLGREEPAVSMDSTGKILWAKHAEMQQANLKTLDAGSMDQIQDGERISLSVKDVGSCEIYPQTLAHNSNGRYVVACGDGEYIVYTAMALRNKAFGSGLEFVWSTDPSEYAVRESASSIKLFKNFKEVRTLRPDVIMEGIEGGPLVAARSANSLCFYDWETGTLIRRIEISAKHVYWSDNAEMVAIAGDDTFYILKYNKEAVEKAAATAPDADGIEDAFDVIAEVQESVKTAIWIGDCFIFTTDLNRLNYYVGGEIVTIAHLDRPLYLLGYMPKESRLYLCDKDHNFVSYRLMLSVLEYQTAVMRRDFDTADKVLPTVSRDQRTRVAHFLEKQGFKKQALAVSQDSDHRFELALMLGELKLAYELAVAADSEEKWRQLSQAATLRSELMLAGECLGRARDYGGLLLLATSAGSATLVAKLASDAEQAMQYNSSFLSYLLLGDLDKCLDILISTDRLPEAAFFARTYCPSQVDRVVPLWKERISRKVLDGQKNVGESLAEPSKYPNLFSDFAESLKAEKFLKELAKLPIKASARPPTNAQRNILEEMNEAEKSGALVFYDDGTLELKRIQNLVSQTAQSGSFSTVEASVTAVSDSLTSLKTSSTAASGIGTMKTSTAPSGSVTMKTSSTASSGSGSMKTASTAPSGSVTMKTSSTAQSEPSVMKTSSTAPSDSFPVMKTSPTASSDSLSTIKTSRTAATSDASPTIKTSVTAQSDSFPVTGKTQVSSISMAPTQASDSVPVSAKTQIATGSVSRLSSASTAPSQVTSDTPPSIMTSVTAPSLMSSVTPPSLPTSIGLTGETQRSTAKPSSHTSSTPHSSSPPVTAPTEFSSDTGDSDSDEKNLMDAAMGPDVVRDRAAHDRAPPDIVPSHGGPDVVGNPNQPQPEVVQDVEIRNQEGAITWTDDEDEEYDDNNDSFVEDALADLLANDPDIDS